MLVRVTPLYSGPSWGTLVSFQDKLTILIDCGWSTSLDLKQIDKFSRCLTQVDLILLSHSTFNHLGALPYLHKEFFMRHNRDEIPNSVNASESLDAQWTIPVICTDPVYRLGRIAVYDIFENHALYKNFNLFDRNDVDKAFEKCTRLRYLQSYSIQVKNIDISVCPHAAGHSLGGSIWSIKALGREIVYGISHNATPQWLLEGCQYGAFTRPALFITDLYDNPIGLPQWKIPALRNIIRGVCKALNNGGSVLIPVDVDGTLLELLVYFEMYWSKHSSSMSMFPISLLSPVADSVILAAKTMIEWMEKPIRWKFCTHRFNPFNSFQYVTFLHSREELKSANELPRVIFTTPGSLDIGFSRDIFEEIALYQNNLILFPVAPPPSSFAHQVWRHQHDASAKSNSEKITVHFTKYSKEPLHPDELYQMYLELRSAQHEHPLSVETEIKNVRESVNSFGDAQVSLLGEKGLKLDDSVEDFPANTPGTLEGSLLNQHNLQDTSAEAISSKSFRLRRFGYNIPSFKSIEEIDRQDEAFVEAADVYMLHYPHWSNGGTGEERKGVASVSLEKFNYGRDIEENEKNYWKTTVEGEEASVLECTSSASKRRRLVHGASAKSRGSSHFDRKMHYVSRPHKSRGHRYDDVLSLGLSYKQSRKLKNTRIPGVSTASVGDEQSILESVEMHAEGEDMDINEESESEEDRGVETMSEDSKDEDLVLPAWRRQLRRMITAEPFQYKSEKVSVSVNCGVHVCFGLESLTSEETLRQKLLEMAPCRVCFLPSSTPYCCGLLSSYLKNSSVPIEEIYSFWRYGRNGRSSRQKVTSNAPNDQALTPANKIVLSNITSEEKQQMFDLVQFVEIEVPSLQLIAELDTTLWNELLWSSLCVPQNGELGFRQANSTCVAAFLNSNVELTKIGLDQKQLECKECSIKTETSTDETIANRKNKFMDNFWTPTTRSANVVLTLKKPRFSTAAEKAVQEGESNILEASSHSIATAKSKRHMLIKDQHSQQELLLLGDTAMKSTAAALVNQLPDQVAYAPQGGILTVSNKVAVGRKYLKDRILWQIEGTIDPAYYRVRKCISSQFAMLQHSLL